MQLKPIPIDKGSRSVLEKLTKFAIHFIPCHHNATWWRKSNCELNIQLEGIVPPIVCCFTCAMSNKYAYLRLQIKLPKAILQHRKHILRPCYKQSFNLNCNWKNERPESNALSLWHKQHGFFSMDIHGQKHCVSCLFCNLRTGYTCVFHNFPLSVRRSNTYNHKTYVFLCAVLLTFVY